VFTAISAGGLHTCALTTTSTVWCWGFGGNGELGNGDLNGSGSPVAVTGGLLFKSISAGGAIIQVDNFPHYNPSGHTCGVTTTGVAYCWGSNGRGELGVGPTVARSNTPLKVGGQP
jgi:alpha-tubulin suppressor-like RCC1 family protein